MSTEAYSQHTSGRSTLSRSEQVGYVKMMNDEISWKLSKQMLADTEAVAQKTPVLQYQQVLTSSGRGAGQCSLDMPLGSHRSVVLTFRRTLRALQPILLQPYLAGQWKTNPCV
jgi:hypothetical protein